MTPATLLLASRQAYAIAPDGSVGTADGCDLIGWTVPPRAVVSGPNAALVGQTADGCIVACRGTLPPTGHDGLADWLEDLNATLVTRFGCPGRVHAGFDGAAFALLRGISALLPRGLPLYLTGHSLGGAEAHRLAWELRAMSPSVTTFAAPQVGDSAFAAALSSAVQITRYENGGDIVPPEPPLFYQPAGRVRAVWRGEVLDAYPDGWRGAQIDTLLTGAVIQRHTIGPGSAYATAAGAP